MKHVLTAVGVRVAGRSGPVLDDVTVTAHPGRMLAGLPVRLVVGPAQRARNSPTASSSPATVMGSANG